ncbi:hypothetical protein HYU19_06060 [Candidatus Woesearchaeota archaeon]|nr:hypothetical protein [Candidatus Woesearchaeota archaeon]
MAAINTKDIKAVSMLEHWVDFLFYTLLVIGFVVSLILQSAFLSYIVIVLFGIMAGRILFHYKKYVTTYIILFGFLVGFVAGSRFADWLLLVLFFLFGASAGYYIHQKKWLV